MQPVDMGCDLYEPADRPEETESGIRRRAPYQYGSWVFTPAYNSTLMCLCDTVTGAIWTRSGHPAVAAAWDPESLKKLLFRLKLPSDLRWVHCFRIAPGNDLKQAALLVVDFMHSSMIYAARRALLEQYFPELGIAERPEAGKMHLVPQFPEVASTDLWCALHQMNDEWKHPYYVGMVAKQVDSKYHMQNDDFNIQSLRWHFHQFAAPLSNDAF